MAALTSKQITELADQFLAFAKAVGDYRIHHDEELTASQKKDIRSYHKQLLSRADEFYTSSAILVMDEIETSLKSIKDVTAKIEKTYLHLVNIQKAIDIAAACVKMGVSIFSLNTANISQSLSELLSLFAEPKSIKIPKKKKA